MPKRHSHPPVRVTGAVPISASGGRIPTRERMEWGWASIIIAATLLAYFPALRAGFVWDDDAHITAAALRSWSGLVRIWCEPGATQQYYPVLHTWFWLQSFAWGDSPLGYHLINVVLHAAAACLVGLNLRRLQIPGAWFATAIFALHPVHVESVAWISEQKNTLSAVFYLGAMLAFWRFHATRRGGAYFCSTALFACALGSKTVTATLPAALLVLLWWRNGRLEWRRDVLPLLPWLGLGVAAAVATVWVERHYIGATGVEFELSALQRGLLATRAIWFYLGKLLWPANLIFIYPRWDISPVEAQWWVYLLGVIAITIGCWRWRQGRAPLAAWLFFVGTLFPALGFFDVYPFLYSFVADHFQYLASLGVITLFAAGIVTSLSHASPRWRWAGGTAMGAALVALATLTWQQSKTYRDPRTFYTTIIARNPSCWMAHYNLGNLHRESGKIELALADYERAVRANPKMPDAHTNWGIALQARGQLDAAITHYEEALRIEPRHVNAHNQLGIVLSQQGKFTDALAHHREALRWNPNRALTHLYIGNRLRSLTRFDEAIAHYETALRLDSKSAAAHLGLGNVFRDQSRLEDAQRYYQAAIQLEPNHAGAFNNLGTVLLMTGRTPEAIQCFQQALQINPELEDARKNLRIAQEIARR